MKSILIADGRLPKTFDYLKDEIRKSILGILILILFILMIFLFQQPELRKREFFLIPPLGEWRI